MYTHDYAQYAGRKLSLHYTIECSEVLTTMIGFSGEGEHQQKKRDDLSSILYACRPHDDAITKFVVYFSDRITEHGVLLLRSQTANEECLDYSNNE